MSDPPLLISCFKLCEIICKDGGVFILSQSDDGEATKAFDAAKEAACFWEDGAAAAVSSTFCDAFNKTYGSEGLRILVLLVLLLLRGVLHPKIGRAAPLKISNVDVTILSIPPFMVSSHVWPQWLPFISFDRWLYVEWLCATVCLQWQVDRQEKWLIRTTSCCNSCTSTIDFGFRFSDGEGCFQIRLKLHSCVTTSGKPAHRPGDFAGFWPTRKISKLPGGLNLAQSPELTHTHTKRLLFVRVAEECISGKHKRSESRRRS